MMVEETVEAARLLVCLSKRKRMCGTYGCVLPDMHVGLHKFTFFRGNRRSDCSVTQGGGSVPIVVEGIRKGSRVKRHWNPTTNLLSVGKWHYGTVCHLRQVDGGWRAQVKYDDGLCQWVNPFQLHIINQVTTKKVRRGRTGRPSSIPLKADGTPDMRFNINAGRS